MHTRRKRPRADSLLVVVLGVVATFALVTAQGAGAAGTPGVHIDPNSPVAKQYSMPLAVARGAAPGGSSQGQLFGHGITRAAAPAPVPVAAPPITAAPASSSVVHKLRRARHKRNAKPATAHRRRRARAHAAAVPRATTAPPAELHSSSGAGLAWMIGLAALVLALGGAGAYALTAGGRRGAARAR